MMKKWTFALVAGTAMVFALVAPCRATWAQSQTQMNMDAGADFEKADAELNTVYKKLLARLDKTGQAKLKKAQRAWIAYRDAEIAVAADTFRGGSMSPMVASNAAARITRDRTKMLKQYIDDYSHR